jgi:hypothetical protein
MRNDSSWQTDSGDLGCNSESEPQSKNAWPTVLGTLAMQKVVSNGECRFILAYFGASGNSAAVQFNTKPSRQIGHTFGRLDSRLGSQFAVLTPSGEGPNLGAKLP